MRRITLSLGFTLLLLAAAATLLTNIVILPFWIGDAQVREGQHLRRLLAASAGGSMQTETALPAGLQRLLAETPGSCLLWAGTLYPDAADPGCVKTLRPLVEAAAQSGADQVRPATITPMSLLAPCYLAVAVASHTPDGRVAAIGAAVPLVQVLQPVWSKERIILVYLLCNALVLAALAFVRLLQSQVRPIDRLVEAAENYHGEGLDSVWPSASGNALGRLAGSIQAMVRRIEEEKRKLAETALELAESNRQLRENQAEMVRAEKLASVGRLAAGLAHEIGNPLGVAQGYLQLMAMEGSEPGEIAEYADRARKELERVDGLIRQLLDFARSSRSRREQFDLHDLLAEMADSLRMQPFLEGIELALDCAAEPSTVFADPEQLRQVVLNCLINSADAIRAQAPAEGGLIRLVTAPADEAGRAMLQLAIIDNGEGIEPAMIEAVFDPFFTTKEPGAGTGLGLSVSLSLIESMGGRMRLASAKGEGATVTLLLPVDEAGGAAASGSPDVVHT